MRLDIYSHHIKVSSYNEAGKDALFQFCRPLVQHKLEYVRGRYIKRADKTFAAATANKKEFRFHVNQKDDLLLHLRNAGFSGDRLTVVEHGLLKSDFPAIDHIWVSPKAPRGIQPGIIDYVLTNDFPSKMVTLQTGKGKATHNDTLVKVPDGWKRMGKIQVGDFVISRDGTPTRVNGVFPQGKLQLYKVTFADGRSVEVCGEHLWQSFYVNCQPRNRWAVRNTLEMKRLISMPNPRVYIPLTEPEDTPEVSVDIDPWLMGVIIGDGSITQGTVNICTPDQYIVDRVKRICPKGLLVKQVGYCDWAIVRPEGAPKKNPMIEALRSYSLWGSRAEEKFIPLDYLNGSIEQRKQLIQGLMDTDGTVQKSGSLSYSTTSEQLAKDVQYLVRSLGGIAAIRPRQTHYTHNGEKKPGQLCYEVDIRHSKPSDFVSLPKKKERINDNNQYSKDLKLRVVSIEPSRVDEATCIAVDHPEKLYVVQDFIVTHNTFVAMWCMKELGLRTVFIFKGGYVDRWITDLEETFTFKKGELVLVRGGGGMRKLMEMGLDGTLEAKALIITFGTMRDYLKNYKENSGPTKEYPIPPGEFYQKLGIGFRVIDEVHQEFYLNFSQDLFTHTYKSLSLSATMESSDSFMNRMYDIAYPIPRRNDGGGYDAYIAVTAVMYNLSIPKAVRYKGAQGGYSHNAFEDSIRSKKDIFPNYLKMIEFIVGSVFVSKREEGQKMLVFCASVTLCTIVAERLAKVYPTLTVARYCQGDDYQDLLDADIGVSTVLSAGTAVDIPNLRVTLLTTAIDSRQSNEQTLGRTRRLKDWPDVTPEFYYLVCRDVDRHIAYHANKREFFKGKVISHKEINLPFIV